MERLYEADYTMALYVGNPLQSDEIKIGSPVFAKIHQAEIASDVIERIDAWFNAGLTREDVHSSIPFK